MSDEILEAAGDYSFLRAWIASGLVAGFPPYANQLLDDLEKSGNAEALRIAGDIRRAAESYATTAQDSEA